MAKNTIERDQGEGRGGGGERERDKVESGEIEIVRMRLGGRNSTVSEAEGFQGFFVARSGGGSDAAA